MPFAKKRVVEQQLGLTERITCSSCQTKQSYVIARQRTWLTLLNIPIFVISTGYSYSCPKCKNRYPLVKQQAKYMLDRAIEKVSEGSS